MKKAVISLLAVLTLAGIAYLVFQKFKGPEESGYVTETITRGDIVSSVSATGRVDPKVSVLVGTEVSGPIREIYVDNNSVVKKGQVLLKLDQETFKSAVAQARANLKGAEARLQEQLAGRDMQRSSVLTALGQKQATLAKVKASFERQKVLFGRGIVSQQDLDNAKEALDVAIAQHEQAVADRAKDGVTDAQIESARAAVEQARAGLVIAETNLGKTVIRAPMDGVVINKNVEVGQTVAASFSTPELLDIGDLKTMEVEVSIDEADVGQVKVGQDAEFTVDAFPEKVFKGRVSEIYYAPITVQNVVTYTGIVEVDNPELLLRPGMTANVNVITSRKSAVLLLPNAALRVDMGEDVRKKNKVEAAREGRTVWTLKGGEPEAVRVRLGITDFTNTEILSGMDEGDTVVVDVNDKTSGGKASGGSGGRPHGMRL
ncbi:MAG: efflux RND transporter periplasmic adaptor subunit [Nitrospirae bacterium]|nr:efflux RND transporter periplasmic adaptor subunit [Nitrospirota bacterium]